METITQLLAGLDEETITILWLASLVLLLAILAFIPFIKEHTEIVVQWFKMWLISIAVMLIAGIFIPNPVGAFFSLPCAILTAVATTTISINFGWQIVKLILFVFSFGNLSSETYRNGYSESQYRANGGSTGVKW